MLFLDCHFYTLLLVAPSSDIEPLASQLTSYPSHSHSFIVPPPLLLFISLPILPLLHTPVHTSVPILRYRKHDGGPAGRRPSLPPLYEYDSEGNPVVMRRPGPPSARSRRSSK